jgi:cell division protein FtsI/penicillin-binding protein 2
MTRRDWLLSALPLLPPSGGSSLASSRRSAVQDEGDAAVFDSISRRILFQQGDCRHATLPGSTLEPFVLAALLERRLLKPGERLECPGGFRLGNRELECTHLRNAGPLEAGEALAASCNFWFAVMARRLGRDGLLQALRKVGLAAQRAPSEEQVCLQALGLTHVSASPWTLARAYAALLQAGPPTLVLQGMRAAVERGTAQRASSSTAWIAGKTGTAPGGLPGTSAGWFGGWALRGASAGKPACPPADISACLHSRPGIVFAVRVVGGTGGGAAAELGKELAERWALSGC